MADPPKSKPVAPWYRVPSIPVLSVEHPCIVQNTERAVQMLGGPGEVGQHLGPNHGKSIAIKFQPDDPGSRPALSFNRQTNNLLLEIRVPKRTGRKRKRGSDEPFVDDQTGHVKRRDARYLLRSLRDNLQRHTAEVVGTVRTTHIWRTMPEYVYSTNESAFLGDIKSKILSRDYALLKQWSLPQTYGLEDTETIPPAIFSTHNLPLNYTYRQNPAVKTVEDPLTGKPTLRNINAPIKIIIYQCQYGDEKWPDHPPAECRPLSELPENQRQLYQIMRDLFETRPIWTRRALINNFPDDAPVQHAKHILPYVAFAIRSGPWRDTVCKYGVDPRTDRSFRKYQSVLILLPGLDRTTWQKWQRSKDRNSHIFTGAQGIPYDGNIWQLCDIHDPQLQALVDVPEIYIRHECEPRYFGWYGNGTMAKIRVVLKAKVDALITGESFESAALDKFLTLPETWDGSVNPPERLGESVQGYLGNDASKKELEWASAYRSLCRTQIGSLPKAGGSGKGRLTKSKPFTRPSFLGSRDGQTSEDRDSNAAAYDEPDEGDYGLSSGPEGDEVDEAGDAESVSSSHDGTAAAEADTGATIA